MNYKSRKRTYGMGRMLHKRKTGKSAAIRFFCIVLACLTIQGCAGQNRGETETAETVVFGTEESQAFSQESDTNETEENRTETAGETEIAGPETAASQEAGTESFAETQEELPEESFVAQLDVADEVTQLIVVETETADSREAVVTMHQLTDGRWEEILRTDGYVGYNGIDKEEQGDRKTPTGLYAVSTPFGLGADPGSREPYTQVDEHYWWVGDGNSRYYNQLVRDDVEGRDWDEAFGEHLVDYGDSYRYCLFIEYNMERVPGKGSCIFLHCNGQNPYTMGCVSIPEEDMIFVLQNVGDNCRILIDTTANLDKY